MKIGVTCNALDAEDLKKLSTSGMDYGEFSFRDVAYADKKEFERAREAAARVGFPLLHANCLFKGETVLLGDGAAPVEEISDFLERGFSRSAALGAKSVVFGSGASRRVPRSKSLEQFETEILPLFELMCKKAEKYKIDVVIEPLNRFETNFINTVEQGYSYINDVASHIDNLFLLADSYHMRVEGESFDTLKDYKKLLRHTHIAAAEAKNANIRLFPDEADGHNIKPFTDALKKMKYDGDVTVEAGTKIDRFTATCNAAKALRSWLV